LKMARQGADFSGKKIVCIVTGSGLKDPDTAIKNAPSILKLPSDIKIIERSLGWD